VRFEGKSVLITGGTGSLGQQLVKTLLAHPSPPRRIIVFSRDELKQSEMAQKRPMSGSPMRYWLGDVRDRPRLMQALSGVDIIIHTAALKQVPSGEYNPDEVIKTNVIGTQNVVSACIACGVSQMLLISTDKAVNPINLYGATKLCAERVTVQGTVYAGGRNTQLAVARYGNVVGSRGSVVPLFQEQAKSGYVTITDTQMTRFWITLPQAAAFILQCLDRMQGGEVFVPRLPSMRVTDLAEAVAPGYEQRIIGIRGGEKVHEELISEQESRHTRQDGSTYIIYSASPYWQECKSGDPVPAGWSYRSDTNDWWLGVDDLRGYITCLDTADSG